MDVAILEGKDYITAWNNNKKQAKPIMVPLDPLTAGQRAVLLEKIVNSEDADYISYGIRCAINRKIENLSVAGKQIETADQLLNSRGAGLDALVLDIGKEVIVLNKRRDLKNSSPPSG